MSHNGCRVGNWRSAFVSGLAYMVISIVMCCQSVSVCRWHCFCLSSNLWKRHWLAWLVVFPSFLSFRHVHCCRKLAAYLTPCQTMEENNQNSFESPCDGIFVLFLKILVTNVVTCSALRFIIISFGRWRMSLLHVILLLWSPVVHFPVSIWLWLCFFLPDLPCIVTQNPPVDPGFFAKIVTFDATPAAGSSDACAPNIRKAWSTIMELANDAEGEQHKTQTVKPFITRMQTKSVHSTTA